MDHKYKFIETIKAQIQGKDTLSSRDLVKLGIVRSESTLSRWRKTHKGPAATQFSKGKIFYPTESVIAWIDAGDLPVDNIVYNHCKHPVFKNPYIRQLYLNVKGNLPSRATIDDLEKCKAFGSKKDILKNIEQGTEPLFTCDADEAAYYIANSYEQPLKASEYMIFSEEETGKE